MGQVIGNKMRDSASISIVVDRGDHNMAVRNVVCGNVFSGISISDGSCWNVVAGNEISTSSGGYPAGVHLGISANNNIIANNNVR